MAKIFDKNKNIIKIYHNENILFFGQNLDDIFLKSWLKY